MKMMMSVPWRVWPSRSPKSYLSPCDTNVIEKTLSVFRRKVVFVSGRFSTILQHDAASLSSASVKLTDGELIALALGFGDTTVRYDFLSLSNQEPL